MGDRGCQTPTKSFSDNANRQVSEDSDVLSPIEVVAVPLSPQGPPSLEDCSSSSSATTSHRTKSPLRTSGTSPPRNSHQYPHHSDHAPISSWTSQRTATK